MLNYLRKFLDSSDPTASLRHAAYAVVIGCACVWLTYGLYKPGLNTDWDAALALLLAAVTTGKIMGRPAPPPQDGAP